MVHRKKEYVLLATIAVCMMLTACFKDEPLNAECDIERAWIHYDNPEECTWNLTDTIISSVYSSESKITFRIKPGTDKSHLAPQFMTTEGATLEPASGTERDFTHGALPYTVTSQDGNWHRTYYVNFENPATICKYDFERPFLYTNESTRQQYYNWSDLTEDGLIEVYNWASGNGGFAISNPSAAPKDYPTVPTEDGYEGWGVKLTTSATGDLAKWMNIPMAAGNLFIGDFVAESALLNPWKSTKFGKPFDRKPLKFIGYYKYRPGETFQDRYGNKENRVDEGAIYAILYKNHDADGNEVVLYGDNVQTSGQIVAKAIMPEVKPTEEWTKFEIPFEYSGLEFERETLNTFGYNLTVVFSSSKDGGNFRGAIGSTLYIDKVEVICETDTTE